MLTGEKAWQKKGCTKQDILRYLDHPDTRAAITTQFHLLDHPKAHSLPLGVKSWNPDLKRLLGELRRNHHPSPPPNKHNQSDSTLRPLFGNNSIISTTTRPQLLMVNSQPRKMRHGVLATVIRNFNGTVKNTYGERYGMYLEEMRRSKFILSPSGIGLDCYRHWEAIHMGTFPVIEHLNRNDGWFRTLHDLPVAWVNHYDNLTEEFLLEQYPKILAKAHTYKYEKLTRQWWIRMIQSTLQ
eukprot:Sro136_g063920.2  (240) ;mRNA; f:4538-5257